MSMLDQVAAWSKKVEDDVLYATAITAMSDGSAISQEDVEDDVRDAKHKLARLAELISAIGDEHQAVTCTG